MMAGRSLREMIAHRQDQIDLDGDPNEARIIRASVQREPRRSTFVVEALLLFMCLMIVIAVSISVIAFSASMGAGAAHKEAGIVMATNIAEQFASDPASLQESYVQGDYAADCAVEVSMDNAGTLYDATIVISWQDDEIYTLHTSQYVSHAHSGASNLSDDDGQVM